MVLICNSLMISDVEHFIDMPVGYLYVFFEEMSVQKCPFFYRVACFLILSCVYSLYILDVNSFANIF